MKSSTDSTLTSATYEELVREMIVRLGEDPDREGLVRTPERVHKAYDFLSKGYREDPEALLKGALFTVTYDEMVIVKDIEMFSLCEHHMLPFFGKVHVAYIPNGKVIGLSKIPRLIELFSRRLQIQERLTTQIAETIQKVIEPQGVGVVIEARHLCMMMRGVEKQHSAAVTSSMLGCFRNENETRSEFLSLIRNRPNVIRGMHVHPVHADFLVVTEGEMLLAVHDIRPGSRSRGKSGVLRLCGERLTAVYIRPGIVHGFYSARGSTVVVGVTRAWHGQGEFQCRWDDPDLGLQWPQIRDPQLSERDRDAGSFASMVAAYEAATA